MTTVLVAGMVLASKTGAPQTSYNKLTSSEKRAGWELLFDGKTMNGWHNFKAEGIKPGWVVQNDAMVIADPANAGDIVTDKMYDWFDLTLEFNVGKGMNSGVMFHVTNDGDETWHSGPEVQIYDDGGEPYAQKTGFLYELYPSKVDTCNPAGQWNLMQIHIAKDKCWTKINGTTYYEYVLGSKDFWEREKKSKFAQYPEFAKSDKGYIALQGDHGNVSFRNIKIKPIK